MTADRLPLGPRLPVALQTAAWIVQPWDFMKRSATHYGDMFTITLASEGPMVMVSHPSAVKEVFTAPPELLRAGQSNRFLLPVLGPNSVVLLDGDEHKEQRRLLMPAFRGNHLNSYANTITAIAEAEIARWPRDEPVRLHPRMQALTLEVILRVVFGLDRGEQLDRLRAALLRLLALTKHGFALLMLPTLGAQKMRTAIIRRLLREVDRLLYQEIAARRQVDDLEGRIDVLSMLLKAQHEDGRPMTDYEVRDELITLLLAGHETTASALAWAVERIIRHPDTHSRLVEETRGNGHQYVDAIVKETLRLRPVLSVVIRRLMEPMEIGGVPLPAGVSVVPSIYLMHRRPEIYPDPEQFRPERFLEDRAGTYTWLPFGGGPRRCLGATFAECEMRIVLGVLFGGVWIRPVDRTPESIRRGSVTHVPGRGATVVLDGSCGS